MSQDSTYILLQDNNYLKDSLSKHLDQESLQDSSGIDSIHSLKPQGHFLSEKNFEGQLYNIERSVEHQNWASGIIIVAFILLAFARISYGKRFGEILRAFLRRSYTNQLTREGNLFREQISIPLFLIFTASISLLLFHSFIWVFPLQGIIKTDISFFIYLILGVVAFWILKLLFIRFTGIMFNTQRASFEVSLVIFISNLVSGITILPLISLYHFSQFKIFLFLALIMFVFIFIYRFIRIFAIGISYSVFSNLYLFLYLCTLEILPIVIVSKIVINYVMP